MAKIQAFLFDAYGTLFDLRSALTPHAARLGDHMERVAALWRLKQIEYTWTASLRNTYRDFDSVTRDALAFALASEGFDDAALAEALYQSFLTLQPYPDAAGTLEALKARGLRLGILSNGTAAMLAGLLKGQSFAPLIDPVLSVEPLKVFKPDSRVYQLGADTLGLKPDEIGFVSGNAWDAGGAAGFGFRVFWINRMNQPPEYGLQERATVIKAFGALPDVI